MNFIIKLHIFPFDIMVSINQSDKQLKKDLLPMNLDLKEAMELLSLSQTTEGRCVMLSTNQTIIRLKNTKPHTIAHEAFHATEFILNRLEIPLRKQTSEIYAHMIGYIVKEIHNYLKDHKG